MSVTMGNAIRQVKLDISGSDIDLPEQDVRFLCAIFVVHSLILYRPRMRFVEK